MLKLRRYELVSKSRAWPNFRVSALHEIVTSFVDSLMNPFSIDPGYIAEPRSPVKILASFLAEPQAHRSDCHFLLA
jgi:hypothetical protein